VILLHGSGSGLGSIRNLNGNPVVSSTDVEAGVPWPLQSNCAGIISTGKHFTLVTNFRSL